MRIFPLELSLSTLNGAKRAVAARRQCRTTQGLQLRARALFQVFGMQQVAVAVTVRGEAGRELANFSRMLRSQSGMSCCRRQRQQHRSRRIYRAVTRMITAMRQLHCSRASLLGAKVMNHDGVDNVTIAAACRDVPTHLISFDLESAV